MKVKHVNKGCLSKLLIRIEHIMLSSMRKKHAKKCIKVDGVLVLRMIALHAGVMYCTEITDALWKRYLSQHPENLIDEDSSLINFAR